MLPAIVMTVCAIGLIAMTWRCRRQKYDALFFGGCAGFNILVLLLFLGNHGT